MAEQNQNTPQETTPQAPPQEANQNTPQVNIDYDRLAQIVAGKQTVAEESVLKGYFRQQGMTKEQVDQAIATFKQQKEANAPNPDRLQEQLTAMQRQAQQLAVEKEGTLAALKLGVDLNTVPYLLKMADLSGVIGADGKIQDEPLQKAIQKVLDDVPALKPQTTGADRGFVQIGAQGKEQVAVEDAALKAAFGL